VVTGAGKAFCAGQDLKEVTAPDAPDFYTVVEETYNASIRRIRAMEKPVIAAVNGVAAGAGANIALACDLVVARESAAFIQAFSKIGLIPDSGGTWMLPRLVGMQRAAALAFLGDRVSASEAASLGMIYRAVADEVFEAEVDALAVRLAALPTRALGLTKRAFNAGWDQSLSDHLTTERDLQIAAAATADYAEGVAAFLEKRPAHFTGA
jgi:2-(1,2-epoxy-1,2-dihydrophenyl)acetyl-CoA isomerase